MRETTPLPLSTFASLGTAASPLRSGAAAAGGDECGEVRPEERTMVPGTATHPMRMIRIGCV
jgi:hypothetical protein